MAYVVLGTSREQQWTTDSSDVDVNAPSVGSDADEDAPLAAGTVSNNRPYVKVEDASSS